MGAYRDKCAATMAKPLPTLEELKAMQAEHQAERLAKDNAAIEKGWKLKGLFDALYATGNVAEWVMDDRDLYRPGLLIIPPLGRYMYSKFPAQEGDRHQTKSVPIKGSYYHRHKRNLSAERMDSCNHRGRRVELQCICNYFDL